MFSANFCNSLPISIFYFQWTFYSCSFLVIYKDKNFLFLATTTESQIAIQSSKNWNLPTSYILVSRTFCGLRFKLISSLQREIKDRILEIAIVHSHCIYNQLQKIDIMKSKFMTWFGHEFQFNATFWKSQLSRSKLYASIKHASCYYSWKTRCRAPVNVQLPCTVHIMQKSGISVRAS